MRRDRFRLDRRRSSTTAAPSLRITLELEQLPEFCFIADSHEDELRLRTWLRRSGELERLRALIGELLLEEGSA